MTKAVLAKDVESLTLSPLREIRREQIEQRSLLLGLADIIRRFESRIDQRFLGLQQRLDELISPAGRC